MNPLYKGAIASAISAATGLIIGLPVIDHEHFSITNWHGVANITMMIFWVCIVAEARFWRKWADKVLGEGAVDP